MAEGIQYGAHNAGFTTTVESAVLDVFVCDVAVQVVTKRNHVFAVTPAVKVYEVAVAPNIGVHKILSVDDSHWNVMPKSDVVPVADKAMAVPEQILDGATATPAFGCDEQGACVVVPEAANDHAEVPFGPQLARM